MVEAFIGKEACQVGCQNLGWFKACGIGWFDGLWRGSFTWIGSFIWVNGMDLMFKGRSEMKE